LRSDLKTCWTHKKNSWNELFDQKDPLTWNNFAAHIQDMENDLEMFWLPVQIRGNAGREVVTDSNSAACVLREMIFDFCEKKISEWRKTLRQDERIYRAFRAIAERSEILTDEQNAAVKERLLSFNGYGINLPDGKQTELLEIEAAIGKAENRFENNLAHSTEGWGLQIHNEKTLRGFSSEDKYSAGEAATRAGISGFLLTLGQGTFENIIECADDRTLRKVFYEAWLRRASAVLGDDPDYDNSPVIEELLGLFYRKARVLGFKNYADLAFRGRMVGSADIVMRFLSALSPHAKNAFQKEYAEISTYAREHDDIEKLEPWDIIYYLRRVQSEKFDFSHEELCGYFPLPAVISGMFNIAERLYGITFREREDIPLWHSDAQFFEVYDADGELKGALCADLYERTGKRCGAWMDELAEKYERANGDIQLPVAGLFCNFRQASVQTPSLLSVGDVKRLLHEFGHCLHMLLTRVKTRDVSGIRGVPLDGCEFPSQFMENFLWHKESAKLLTCHHLTGEPIPDEIFEKVLASRHFGSGYMLSGEISLSTADLLIFSRKPTSAREMHELYQRVVQQRLPYELPSLMTPLNGMRHLWAQKYTAGYYSYALSRMLAADVFEKFIKPAGSFDWQLGRFLENTVLANGGAKPFMEMVVSFLGRNPEKEALLRSYGFIE